MATQTITVSRTPASGASRSSGTPAPARAAGTDYSLTDLELLEAAESPATEEQSGEGRDEGRQPTNNRAGKGTTQSREAERTPAQDAADQQQQSREEQPQDAAGHNEEFAPAFELPGVGAKLRAICERENAYRQVFPTVEEARAVREVFQSADAARAAAAAQNELARLDALMESRDPRAHAELLAGLRRLAPESLRSLAIAFAEQLPSLDAEAGRQVAQALGARPPAEQPAARRENLPEAPQAAQPAPEQSAPSQAARAAGEFLHAVNADVEQAMRAAVGQKVDELLPDAPEGARQKIAGEIFRELDVALRADPELQEQVRDSVRSALQAQRTVPESRGAWRGSEIPGAGRSARATSPSPQSEGVARLIARRAKAVLPGVARRVVADWTETVLRSSEARRARQSEAARRTEVGRGGAPAPVPARPRRVDYSRMSDEEILNMD